MSARVLKKASMPAVVLAVCAVVFGATMQTPRAQRASEASTPEGQQPPAVPGGGGRGARGRGFGAPVGPARTTAPVDLTGNWVSVVTEDWQWRMMTPKKGDFTSVPLNGQGMQVTGTWDPSKEGMCEAYGVGGIMRIPGRLRISWQDDNTLKIETDAGLQTRLLNFARPGAAPAPVSSAAPKTLQGNSVAEWQRSSGQFDAFIERGSAGASQRWGSLKVTTTGMRAAWLRKNGVPYSENAVITEYFTRFTNPEAGDWFVVTTVVDDPQYLQQQFITSSNFKKEADGSKWSPTPCRQ